MARVPRLTVAGDPQVGSLNTSGPDLLGGARAARSIASGLSDASEALAKTREIHDATYLAQAEANAQEYLDKATNEALANHQPGDDLVQKANDASEAAFQDAIAHARTPIIAERLEQSKIRMGEQYKHQASGQMLSFATEAASQAVKSRLESLSNDTFTHPENAARNEASMRELTSSFPGLSDVARSAVLRDSVIQNTTNQYQATLNDAEGRLDLKAVDRAMKDLAKPDNNDKLDSGHREALAREGMATRARIVSELRTRREQAGLQAQTLVTSVKDLVMSGARVPPSVMALASGAAVTPAQKRDMQVMAAVYPFSQAAAKAPTGQLQEAAAQIRANPGNTAEEAIMAAARLDVIAKITSTRNSEPDKKLAAQGAQVIGPRKPLFVVDPQSGNITADMGNWAQRRADAKAVTAWSGDPTSPLYDDEARIAKDQYTTMTPADWVTSPFVQLFGTLDAREQQGVFKQIGATADGNSHTTLDIALDRLKFRDPGARSVAATLKAGETIANNKDEGRLLRWENPNMTEAMNTEWRNAVSEARAPGMNAQDTAQHMAQAVIYHAIGSSTPSELSAKSPASSKFVASRAALYGALVEMPGTGDKFVPPTPTTSQAQVSMLFNQATDDDLLRYGVRYDAGMGQFAAVKDLPTVLDVQTGKQRPVSMKEVRESGGLKWIGDGIYKVYVGDPSNVLRYSPTQPYYLVLGTEQGMLNRKPLHIEK